MALTIRDMMAGPSFGCGTTPYRKNVSEMEATGTSKGATKGWDVRGRGRKEFESMKYLANNAKGYSLARVIPGGFVYKHPEGHSLTIQQVGDTAQWRHRAAGSGKYEMGNDAGSLEDHLEFMHGGSAAGMLRNDFLQVSQRRAAVSVK